MGRRASEDGTVSAMVAVLAVALLACAGLAFDGGAIITATADARDLAGGAARAGAQQADLAALHDSRTDLNSEAAIAAAEQFLAAAGATGTVTVEGATVTVTVTTSQPMRILPLPARTISATVSATAVSDVLGGTP